MSITAFPQPPGSTPQELIDYIQSPTYQNLESLDERMVVLEALVTSLPVHTSSGAVPSVGKPGDSWYNTSSQIWYDCTTTYSSGDADKENNWDEAIDQTARNQLSLVTGVVGTQTHNSAFIDNTFTSIASDNSCSAAEKLAIKPYYDEILALKAGIDTATVYYQLGSAVEYTDYITAYNTVVSYVAAISLFTDMASATTIPDSGIWSANWTAIREKQVLIQAKIIETGRTIISQIDGNLTSLQSQMNDLASDGIISPTEKKSLKFEWETIQGSKGLIDGQVAEFSLTGNALYVTYVEKYDALSAYLLTKLDLFTSMSTNTVLADQSSTPTEWDLKWAEYYTAERSVDGAIDTEFKSIVDAANVASTEALEAITGLGDDAVISGGSEKYSALAEWEAVQRDRTNLLVFAAKYGTAIPAAFATSYTDLQTYLITTLDLFSNMTEDTAISRPTWTAKWTGYYGQSTAFYALIQTDQATAVAGEPADYDAVKVQLENIAVDSVISSGAEKQSVNAIWADIQTSHVQVQQQATITGASITACNAKYDELETYLGGLTKLNGTTANFTVITEDTVIGSTVFWQKFRSYYDTRAAVTSEMWTKVVNGISAVSSSILDMNNDGVITPQEKTPAFQEYTRMASEVTNLDAQCVALSITTEKTAMDTAYAALILYIDSLESGTGLFTDMSTGTQLDATEQNAWDGKWADSFTTIEACRTAVTSTIIGNTAAVGTASFLKSGAVPMEGDIDMFDGVSSHRILNLDEVAASSGGKSGATTGQIYAEQQARSAADAQEVTDRNTAIGVAISNLLNGAGTAFDTLQELIDAIGISDEETPLTTDLLTLIGNNAANVSPTGTLNPFAGASAPAGWMICNGAAVSRTTYADLFAIISDTYGVGDGSTTFNIPDMRGRTIVGFNAGETEFDALGETGGAKTDTLSIATIPSHNHSGTSGNESQTHTHNIDHTHSGAANVATDDAPKTGDFPVGATFNSTPQAFSTGAASTSNSGNASVGHNHSISAEGGGGAHNNLQPYIAVNYIIKT